jgi:hypothetical protein
MADKPRGTNTQEKRGGYSGSAPAKVVRPASAGATSGGANSGSSGSGGGGASSTDSKR